MTDGTAVFLLRILSKRQRPIADLCTELPLYNCSGQESVTESRPVFINILERIAPASVSGRLQEARR